MNSTVEDKHRVEFRKRLKRLMDEQGYNQMSLGKVVSSRNSIFCYLNGERFPNRSTLKALADQFDVSVEYLIGESDERLKDEVAFYDYASVQTYERQSEVFIAFLLSLGYCADEISAYSDELQEVMKEVHDFTTFKVDKLGILRKLPPHTNTRRKRVKK